MSLTLNKYIILRVLKRSYHKNVIDHFENPRNIGSMDRTCRCSGMRRCYETSN